MVNKGLSSEPSEQSLPPERRIALAVTPAPLRPVLEALLLLDARLGEALARAREPLLAQVRLAWWRERLAEGPAAWPLGNPVLTHLAACWLGPTEALVALVDGWEELLGEAPLDQHAIARFAAGRGAAIAAFADIVGEAGFRDRAAKAGQRWALADFASRASDARERTAAFALARALPPCGPLARALRGVALLDGLAARAVARGEPLLAGRAAALAALRLGLFGR